MQVSNRKYEAILPCCIHTVAQHTNGDQFTNQVEIV